jgi:cell fate (sporulation/competence/biofilm development) regulator YlbF (YheA/YmcA/DUF963 family)
VVFIDGGKSIEIGAGFDCRNLSNIAKSLKRHVRISEEYQKCRYAKKNIKSADMQKYHNSFRL